MPKTTARITDEDREEIVDPSARGACRPWSWKPSGTTRREGRTLMLKRRHPLVIG
jgi:hypothetical protein